MSVAVAVLPTSRWVTRPSFQSVGLVCTCGKAVASYEGYARACDGCGTVYLVTVMVLNTSEPHRAADSSTPPAFADGPVADHPAAVATDRSIEVAEPHRSDLDVMRHG